VLGFLAHLYIREFQQQIYFLRVILGWGFCPSLHWCGNFGNEPSDFPLWCTSHFVVNKVNVILMNLYKNHCNFFQVAFISLKQVPVFTVKDCLKITLFYSAQN